MLDWGLITSFSKNILAQLLMIQVDGHVDGDSETTTDESRGKINFG
jgi:hypothetical protein